MRSCERNLFRFLTNWQCCTLEKCKKTHLSTLFLGWKRSFGCEKRKKKVWLSWSGKNQVKKNNDRILWMRQRRSNWDGLLVGQRVPPWVSQSAVGPSAGRVRARSCARVCVCVVRLFASESSVQRRVSFRCVFFFFNHHRAATRDRSRRASLHSNHRRRPGSVRRRSVSVFSFSQPFRRNQSAATRRRRLHWPMALLLFAAGSNNDEECTGFFFWWLRYLADNCVKRWRRAKSAVV